MVALHDAIYRHTKIAFTDLVEIVALLHDVIYRRVFGADELATFVALDCHVGHGDFDPRTDVQSRVGTKREIVLEQIFKTQAIVPGNGEKRMLGFYGVQDVFFSILHPEQQRIMGAQERTGEFNEIRLGK